VVTAAIPTGDVLETFHSAQCVLWVAASRRRFEDIAAMTEISGRDDGLKFAGDTLLGILALEQALLAARWVAANSTQASTALPAAPSELDREWGSVRVLRSSVVAHMDTWITQTPAPSMKIDARGVHLRDALVFSFAEWRHWLDLLEPWAIRVMDHPKAADGRPGVRPPRIQLPQGQ
jgi:hypothetical protein